MTHSECVFVAFAIEQALRMRRTIFCLWSVWQYRIFQQWRTEGVVRVFNPPAPEILKALQNRAKLNPIVKTVKNC